MGKMINALRLVSERPLTAPALQALAPEPVVEMPYIEIGPRRHMEASADVLASAPPQRLAAPVPRTAPVTPAVPVVPVEPPAPKAAHEVVFRTLPVSRSRFAPELVAYHAPSQAASARYSDLLAALLEAGRSRAGRVCKVLLFTSTRAEVGSTTVLLNLAITAARQGKRVVVVEANLRRPAFTERLGLEDRPGLTEVLSGDSTLIEALQATSQDRLLALCAGSPSAVMTDEAALRELLGGLADDQDLVLVDAPRWDGRLVWTLASLSDAVYLAVPAAEADGPPATDLVKDLPARGVPLVGCVVTGA